MGRKNPSGLPCRKIIETEGFYRAACEVSRDELGIITMALTKAKKEEILDDLRDKVARQKGMILVGITGLKVKDLSDLRKKLKAGDGNLKVIKKTLIEKVFKEENLIGGESKDSSSSSIFDKEEMKTEIALAFGFKDEIGTAKTVYQAGLANKKLKILGGFINNEFNEAELIIALAKLPSKEELLAKLVGSLSAPVSNFVYALNYNIKGLVYILSLIKK